MNESEKRRPERAESDWETESFDIRLSAAEISMLLGGLAFITQRQREELQELGGGSYDEEYKRMAVSQAEQHIDAAERMRIRLSILLDSQNDTERSDLPSNDSEPNQS